MERRPNRHNGLCLAPDEIVKYKQVLESKSRLDESTGCILWVKCTIPKGYGWQSIRGTFTAAHRIAYAVHIGAIPPMIQVCHRCDRPRCINPEHLFLGTAAENQNDKGRKHRSRMKFRPEDVSKMRRLRASGLTQQEIADIFGAGRSTVQGITDGGFRPYVTSHDASHLSACSLPEERSQRQSEQTYLSLPPSLRALHDRLRSAAELGEGQAQSDR